MNVNAICKKAKVIIPFLLMLVNLTTQAQNLLSAKVIDSDQTPLSGATVQLLKENKATVTDSQGEFNVKVPKGNYNVKISYLGFQSVTQEISTEVKDLVIILSPEENILDEVLVSAVRVKANAPVTHSNLKKEEITKRNLGQDIPILMNYLPSVVTTSDAGSGVGYTGIRVRGSDATRVNVTINGIPYNDSESQGTFWVNMPDFASSTESIQLQRGVGTSTNGAGAFGASLNVLTDNTSKTAFGEISSSIGSFNTQKYTVKAGSGKLSNNVSVSGRLSKISSDGYIDRASSDLKSYFLEGSYSKNNTLVKALVFGGHEITYQSWNGTDASTLKSDRTFNSAGALYDEFWNVTGYYDNEVDNYKQDHFQMHWNQKFTENISSNIAIHYTYGRGFFEQYKQSADFEDYNLSPITIGTETINTTDLIRRRWLDNDFYGVTYNLNYKKEAWDVLLGGAWNYYDGDHFGEIIWARNASDSEIRDRYYDNYGRKEDVNVFAKASYRVSEKLSFYGDLQFRSVNYKANGVQPTLVNETLNFFNPKAGVTFNINASNSLYASYARAHKEPNRNDYENGTPKPEKLDDFELGWRLNTAKVKLSTNVYYMLYNDQLVLTGALDDVGAAIRANSGKSYRLGLEIDANITLTKYLSIMPNLTLSQNKNLDFKEENGSTVTDLGDTNISYSPSIIAGNAIVLTPTKGLNVNLLSKFVDEQFLTNTETNNLKLPDYFINDLNVNYTFQTKDVTKEITVSGLLNNITDKEYSSNAAVWDGTTYYYPQAGINFLLGATLKF